MKHLVRAGSRLVILLVAACADGRNEPPVAAAPRAAMQTIKLTTDVAGLVPRVTANGLELDLDERFQHAVIARRNADGTITTDCHDEQSEAEAFVQGATSSQAEVR